ncbi:Protein kinase, ATP binding site domain-containing protein [Rozella allomycis CSF55]|uniref:Protein kinase, ATP binding site domain-containing protein n=1 Tax=Rozella allomycis (strain CSF55) TaxID=988480 RepID=A0A075ASE0_ROZAC|nr:Protein kinase, ATP binding site domain-containing protein [Rozella allomycis CSF55]|eukprot:EPZ31478.1 Protein kinase, ATP binding site domain-containing protein [Rozella allomycis CSF55]
MREQNNQIYPPRTTSKPNVNQYSSNTQQHAQGPKSNVPQKLTSRKPIKVGPFTFNQSPQKLQNPIGSEVPQTKSPKKAFNVGPFHFNKKSPQKLQDQIGSESPQKLQDQIGSEVPQTKSPKKAFNVGPFHFNMKSTKTTEAANYNTNMQNKPQTQISPFFGPDPNSGTQNWALYPVKSLGKGAFGSASLVSDSQGNKLVLKKFNSETRPNEIEQEVSMAREAGKLVIVGPKSI